MKFLRRFLAPVLLSSWLILVALGPLIRGGDLASVLDRALDVSATDIAFMGMFVTAGLLTVGYPTAYFLVRRGVPFWISLPLLMVTGAVGGAAIGFLMSLPGGSLRVDAAHFVFPLMGSLAGLIAGTVWALSNADFFRHAGGNGEE